MSRISIVYHQSTNSQNQNKSRASYRQRDWSLINGLASWCLKRAMGTTLQGPLSFFLDSTIAHLAGTITISIIIGFIFDLLLDSNISSSFPSSSGNSLICTAIGIIGGAWAGGSGGAIVGALWGWLIGKIADASASTLTFEPLKRYIGALVAWIFAGIIGGIFGKVASWSYDKVAIKNRVTYRVLGNLAITIVLSAFAIVIYKILESNNNTILPDSANNLMLLILLVLSILIGSIIIFIINEYFGFWNIFPPFDYYVSLYEKDENEYGLIGVLEHNEAWSSRLCAAQALGRMGNPWTIEPLLKAGKNDRIKKVREAASGSAFSILRSNLNDKNVQDIYFNAIRKIFGLDDSEIEELKRFMLNMGI